MKEFNRQASAAVEPFLFLSYTINRMTGKWKHINRGKENSFHELIVSYFPGRNGELGREGKVYPSSRHFFPDDK